MGYRTERFKAIAEQTESDYAKATPEDRPSSWRRTIVPKWRNRVGMPRLIAENATVDAFGTFRSINRGIFRDPAERARYDRALAALEEFSVKFAEENWRRFNAPPAHTDGSER